MSVASHRLNFMTPPRASDEGLPLANGLLGALVWGDGQPLTISLDRTDLWDLREIPEYRAADYTLSSVVEAHRAGRHDELIRRLEAPYQRAAPTKLPAGRIEIRVADAAFKRATLEVGAPVADIALGAVRVRVLVHAEACVGIIRIDGAAAIELAAPTFGGPPADWVRSTGFDASIGDVWDLGYAAPTPSAGDDVSAFTQTCFGGFSFAVVLCHIADGNGTTYAWSIAHSLEGDALALATKRARAALATPLDTLVATHLAWWSAYWARSRVVLPDAALDRTYHLDMYKFGAAARRGAPPISLQGPWTSDNGRLPPWKGDYHHDLNTQMSYWPAYTGNHLEAGLGFLDWLWETRPACRDWTRQFFAVEGLNVPMATDLLNRQIGGWRQYAHSVATSAWLAHHFYLHWRFSGDRDFLVQRAYPYLEEVCRFIEAITETRDAAGHRSVSLSASPEINNNTPEAWFDTITTYEATLFRWALAATSELALEIGQVGDAARWTAVRDEFAPPAVAKDGVLQIADGHPLAQSHRHFSHLIGIHPLGTIDMRRKGDGHIISASLAQIAALGTDLWMGYSFSWYACLLARAGRGDAAAVALDAYRDGFLLANSFHANGDFAGKGYSQAVFRAFTLEGNCAAAQAVHEMLLQSHGGEIHLFPAVPPRWRDVSFERLLAERAIMVSAIIASGHLVKVELESRVSQNCIVVAGRGSSPVGARLHAGKPVLLDEQLLRRLDADLIQTDPTLPLTSYYRLPD